MPCNLMMESKTESARAFKFYFIANYNQLRQVNVALHASDPQGNLVFLR